MDLAGSVTGDSYDTSDVAVVGRSQRHQGEMNARLPAAPPASTPAVRAVMQANKKRDTKPERAVRSALHARGLRFRVNLRIGTERSAPRPDIAFTRAKIAVFVDGCFWHGCPEHGLEPRTNASYWSPKLARNRERDREDDEALEHLGWTVIRVWEHADPEEAADEIARWVGEPPKERP